MGTILGFLYPDIKFHINICYSGCFFQCYKAINTIKEMRANTAANKIVYPSFKQNCTVISGESPPEMSDTSKPPRGQLRRMGTRTVTYDTPPYIITETVLCIT